MVLVVDLSRVLDESAPGKAGAAALQAKFDELKAQHDKLKGRGTTEKGAREAAAAAAAFEVDARKTLETERAQLRDDVLKKVRPVIAEIMSEKKASVVVDASAVLAVAAAVDITADVIARVK